MKRKIVILFFVISLALTILFLQLKSINSLSKFKLLIKYGSSDDDKLWSPKLDEIKELLELNRRIARAHRYARSTVAMYELNKAFSIVNDLLKTKSNELTLEKMAVDQMLLKNDQELPEVCPEIYKGMTYGYPYYFTGYVTDTKNCTSQPMGNLLTVILNAFNDITVEDVDKILNGLSIHYPNVKTIVAYRSKDKNLMDGMQKKYVNLKSSVAFDDKSDAKSGLIWKNLSSFVDTKYTFVGRGLLRFDNHTLLERMVRFLSFTKTDVVAGSHRFTDGRWFRGCYAAGLRNYTLKLVDGYDLSYNSCIYCDYVSSPFVIRTKQFRENVDESLSHDMVFVDLLMHLKSNVDNATMLTCPDVMFVVRENQAVFTNHTKDYWLDFVIKWQLNRIILPNRQTLTYTCPEAKSSCAHKGGMILPICCLQTFIHKLISPVPNPTKINIIFLESPLHFTSNGMVRVKRSRGHFLLVYANAPVEAELIDAIKFMATMCKKRGIDCEVEAGSGVGAVKMYGVTPYERDADFDWLAFNQSVMESMIPEFEAHNYKLVPTPTNYSACLYTGVNCGYYAFRTDNWRLELWGATYLGSDEAFKVGLKHRTRVNFDGVWVTTLHSPALAARNEYGDDIFEHVEHWSTLGHSTGWVQPTSGRFLPCPKPGFHGCLDMYLPVGNIQFQDVWI